MYDVTVIGEAEAKAFVLGRHYSGAYPAAAKRYGLIDVTGDAPRLTGVAVLSIPARREVLTKVFPELEPFLNNAAPSTHW